MDSSTNQSLMWPNPTILAGSPSSGANLGDQGTILRDRCWACRWLGKNTTHSWNQTQTLTTLILCLLNKIAQSRNKTHNETGLQRGSKSFVQIPRQRTQNSFWTRSNICKYSHDLSELSLALI